MSAEILRAEGAARASRLLKDATNPEQLSGWLEAFAIAHNCDAETLGLIDRLAAEAFIR